MRCDQRLEQHATRRGLNEMGRFRYYQRDIAKAVKGTENLTLEQTGLYEKLIDRIYATEDNLELVNAAGEPQHANLARRCNCDVRTFKRVLETLIALKRLSTEPVDKSVYIRDERASITCRSLGDRFELTAHVGRSNAGKSNAQRKKSTTYADDETVVEIDRIQNPDSRQEEYPSSSRSLSASRNTGRLKPSDARKGGFRSNGRAQTPPTETTIKDEVERMSRFQTWLRNCLDRAGKNGWQVIASAMNVHDPYHHQALETCKATTIANNKGWPWNWPTNAPPKPKHEGR